MTLSIALIGTVGTRFFTFSKYNMLSENWKHVGIYCFYIITRSYFTNNNNEYKALWMVICILFTVHIVKGKIYKLFDLLLSLVYFWILFLYLRYYQPALLSLFKNVSFKSDLLLCRRNLVYSSLACFVAELISIRRK